MTEKPVRVRFAPSPTGPLHMGGVRTALYNYLFAKKHGGTFLLRIEDTDQTRFVPGAEEYIIESLKWCGIVPDEGQSFGGNDGPYRQSERKNLYRQYADQLIESGHAYYAFDTPEELDAVRERAKRAGVASWQYSNITRSSMKNSLTLSEDEVKARLDAGDSYVIRIKMPRNEEIRVQDIIRGWVVVNSNQLDDKVLYKSDGMPTYHLANIVDDHLMNISHVIRGEEWLPSAPLHVLLYQHLGWEAPEFAHLPLLLKPDGNGKLSKRDGDRLGFPVFPLEWTDPVSGDKSSGYRENGYFPEAFINMLALLGWNPGNNQEFFTLDELVEAFSLERVGKSGSKFDPDKARWFNQHYLRLQSDESLARSLMPHIKDHGIEADLSYVVRVVALLKERAVFVVDMLEGLYLFQRPSKYDEGTLKKKWKEDTPAVLRELKERFAAVESFNAAGAEEVFKALLEQKGLGFGAVMPNLRVLITGQGMGPSLFDVCELLGREEVLARMESGLQKLG
ncbi:MAG: glutamate--tRNA ligase [Cryomorphaceae bacterium]|nr:MAG: glutamate--tRNA ligase [Cryomorphaceae bacterium]